MPSGTAKSSDKPAAELSTDPQSEPRLFNRWFALRFLADLKQERDLLNERHLAELARERDLLRLAYEIQPRPCA